jgi:hypothetical protein
VVDYQGLVKRLNLPIGWAAPTELTNDDIRASALTRDHQHDDVRGINASLELIRRTRGGRWPTEPVTDGQARGRNACMIAATDEAFCGQPDLPMLIPGLHFLRCPVGQADLVPRPGRPAPRRHQRPGSAPKIATAIRTLGHELADPRRLMLTHFHADHAGSAAEITAWGGAEVCAHHADTPFLRGEAPRAAQDLADWEWPIFGPGQQPDAAIPPTLVRIDRELDDSDELSFGGGTGVGGLPADLTGCSRLSWSPRAGARAAAGPQACHLRGPTSMCVSPN